MNIEIIGVIGAGAAGREIARTAILGGVRTILEDVSPERLERAIASIKESLRAALAGGEITEPQAAFALERLSTASRVDTVARVADMLIETVPDEMEVKLEIFTILDKFAKPDAILASNTSLSIAEIASITFRTENCVGMRFVHRPSTATLLEIVRGPDTSDQTVAACLEIGRRMGFESRVADELAESSAGGTVPLSRAKGHSE